MDMLRARQSYPLDFKVDLTVEKLGRYALKGAYISFSGGKDSMVLLDIATRHNINIRPIFIDTGLEYPEVRKIGRKYAHEVIRPKMTFKKVLDTYGYPIVSKSQAMAIRKLTTQNLSDRYRNKLLNGDERGSTGKLSNKWHYLLDSPFKISEQCCDIMKKKPVQDFTKKLWRETGIVFTNVTAEMADESMNRKIRYMQNGCFHDNKYPKLTPMAFWTEQDVLEYVYKYQLPIASVYGDIRKDSYDRYYLTGVQRTGCMFCAFGTHLEKEPNRFQRMQKTHPKQYKYCMKNLGMEEVLEYINIPYKEGGQLKLF